MRYINIMGMEFEEDNIPDFGSICLVSHNKDLLNKTISTQRINNKKKEVNQYLLLSKDIAKLDLIYNALDGSNAFCSDTNDMYILHCGTWRKVGNNTNN